MGFQGISLECARAQWAILLLCNKVCIVVMTHSGTMRKNEMTRAAQQQQNKEAATRPHAVDGSAAGPSYASIAQVVHLLPLCDYFLTI